MAGFLFLAQPRSVTGFQTLKIGAGGNITEIVIAADGTMACRNDTYGAHRWNASTSAWVQQVSAAAFPNGDPATTPFKDDGCLGIAIAPSNTQRMYMMYLGYIYRTDNAGASWVSTNSGVQLYTWAPQDANQGKINTFGPYIAVDPINADVAYASTPSSGCFYTANAGGVWNAISAVGTGGLPAGASLGGGHLIVADPSSAQSGGKTQGWYLSTYGTGVYHSTNGGGTAGTWSLLNSANMPTTHKNLKCLTAGVLWQVDNTGDTSGGANKFTAATWTPVDPSNGSWTGAIVSIDQDPNNAARLMAGLNWGGVSLSTNSGATWTVASSNVDTYVSSATIPWLDKAIFQPSAGAPFSNFFSHNFVFSPSSAAFQSVGIGVAMATSLQGLGSGTTAWTDQSAGIEQLVANAIISPPTGNPVCPVWDRQNFKITNPNVYPSNFGVTAFRYHIDAAWSTDWASATPGFLVTLCNFSGIDQASAFSSDGGGTWTLFANVPTDSSPSTNVGGCIAASTTTNFVWVTVNGDAWYTLNGGTSAWTKIALPGVAAASGWPFADFLKTRVVTADRVNPNTFYCYNTATGGGVFRSTNSGVTWVQRQASLFPNGGNNQWLESVPNVGTVSTAGHLFYTAGNVQPGPWPHTQSFYFCGDGGATWTALANVKEVWNYGFGAPKPGGNGYPTIYMTGWVSNVYGTWRCDNFNSASPGGAQSWTLLTTYANNSLDNPTATCGDTNTYGICYVGFTGSGYAYFTP